MGCDIHWHLEVKINGRWEHFASPDNPRSYALFARMAGVRNSPLDSIRYVQPIDVPRGMVGDPSVVTEIARHDWGVDAHSESWLTGEEVDALCDETEVEGSQMPNLRRLFGYGFGNGFSLKDAAAGDFPDVVEAFRLVFWFDN